MATTQPALIEYYKSLHSSKSYGRSAHNFLMHIQACVTELQPARIVEYGCGQSQLIEQLQYAEAEYIRYDPAVPAYDTLSVDSADFVVNTDVLEHVPEESLDDVLQDIARLSSKVFFNICTRPASEILPDGRNAHVSLMPAEQWLTLIKGYFPDARLVFVDEREECLILTWDAKAQDIVSELCRLRVIEQQYNAVIRPWYKKLERQLRKLKDKLTGRQKHYRR